MSFCTRRPKQKDTPPHTQGQCTTMLSTNYRQQRPNRTTRDEHRGLKPRMPTAGDSTYTNRQHGRELAPGHGALERWLARVGSLVLGQVGADVRRVGTSLAVEGPRAGMQLQSRQGWGKAQRTLNTICHRLQRSVNRDGAQTTTAAQDVASTQKRKGEKKNGGVACR